MADEVQTRDEPELGAAFGSAAYSLASSTRAVGREDSGLTAHSPRASPRALLRSAGTSVVDGENSMATAPSPKTPKQPSLLGAALGRCYGPHEKKISEGITKKYKNISRETEAHRLSKFQPIGTVQKYEVAPDALNMTRTLKSGLDSVTESMWDISGADRGSEACSPASSSRQTVRLPNWDDTLNNADARKQLLYLQENAKTGHFCEQIGTDGRYEGDYLYGLRHGHGRHEFRDEVFVGMWKWDKRNGRGELTARDGSSVIGDWKDDKLSGVVTIKDKRGATYEGECKDGKRHGIGRQSFESGDVYDGGWYEGKLHDRGVYSFANGDKFYGLWAHGQYDGPGVLHYHNGGISRREYRNGILQSVQDFDSSSQKFGRVVNREDMVKRTNHEVKLACR